MEKKFSLQTHIVIKPNNFVTSLEVVDPIEKLYDGKDVEGVISLHVDDLGISGTKRFKDSVIVPLGKIFEVGSAREGCFRHCGKNVETLSSGNGFFEIWCSTQDYIGEMELVKFETPNSKDDDQLSDNCWSIELVSVPNRM